MYSCSILLPCPPCTEVWPVPQKLTDFAGISNRCRVWLVIAAALVVAWGATCCRPFLVPIRFSKDRPVGAGTVTNLSLYLTSDLGVCCVLFASVARGPNRLACGWSIRDLILSAGLIRAIALTIVCNSASNSSIFVWTASLINCLPCWVMKCIPSLVKALFHNSRWMLNFNQLELVGIFSNEVPDPCVLSGHVPVHEVGYRGNGVRV